MDDDHDFETASNRKAKNKINIFDDEISIDAASKIIKSFPVINEEDDDDDEISFDGTPVVKFSNRPGAGNMPISKAPMPDLSDLAMPATTSLASRTNSVTDDNSLGSQTTFGSVSSAMIYSHNRSKSLIIGSSNMDKDISTPVSLLGSNSSLQDIDELGGSHKKQMSSTDIDKMQQEIQSLRRSLLSAKRERWVKLPTEDTLRRIIKGEDFTLEMYRSLEDKLELLDKATQKHDGNAITTAVLFLQRTVARPIFTRELLSRPVAANHYLNYLKAHFDHIDYINTLILLGRKEEAAIFKFKLALQASDVTMKISKIRDSLRSNFQADPALAADSSLVQDYVDLLEAQRPIDESDANLEASGKSGLFRDFPRRRSLIDMPVVTTLYYCCLYHYDLAENSLASPEAIRKRHQKKGASNILRSVNIKNSSFSSPKEKPIDHHLIPISDKQYTWTAISARSKLRQWKDIDALMTTKGWFGGTKMKSVIGFVKIVGILHKNRAPPDILEKYLVLIDDIEMRLNLAKKVSCPKAVIDTLVAMKNRPELEAYVSNLDRYSKEGLYASDILNSSAIKWK